MRAALPVSLPEVAVSARIPHRRTPCVQEVRPEGEDIVGILDIEIGNTVLPEDRANRHLQVRAFKSLIRCVLATEFVCEASPDQSGVPSARPCRQNHSLLTSTRLEILKLEGEPAYGVSPADLLELRCAAFARAHQWPTNPVRVVQRLEACLAARAVLARVHRVVNIPLYLLCATFHHPDDDAYAARAIWAQGRIPIVTPGNQVFGHTNGRFDKQLVLWYTAGGE